MSNQLTTDHAAREAKPMRRKEIISFAASQDLHKRSDAHLLLTQPSGQWNVSVIRFSCRAALEAFNKKARLFAVVKTQVPMNAMLYKHQSDSVAREALVTA